LFPVSLTVYNDLLYVVNLASATISGFTIGSNGSLTLINGSKQALSHEGATPAQISFSPFGNCLLVTEKTANKITRFPVNSGGVAGPGSSMTSANTTPFGFDFSNGYIIISEAAGGTPNASSVTSYFGSNYITTPSCVSGPIHAGQTSSSWVKVTSDGAYAYVSNTGCNTLSLFGVSRTGIVTSIDPVAAVTGSAPADLTLSSDENFLYVINSMSHSISAFKTKPNGNIQSINETTGLPPFAAGLVAL
jgi:6-phosphogluconolactonase (cycloisomerase 2 family)